MQQKHQSKIRQLFDEYIEMYSARDDRLTARFSQNFTGFTGSWGRLIQDHTEWVAVTRQDFAQVPGRLRMDLIDLSLQDLGDKVVAVAATMHIHLPNNEGVLANEVVRLVLVFRLEDAEWMITHCSYSVPYRSAQDEEIFPIKSLQEENAALHTLVAERTRALEESQAFYRMLTEDAEDVHWRMDRNFVMTYISPADERMRGFRADEVLGHPVFDLLTEETRAKVRQVLSSSATDLPVAGPTVFRQIEVQLICKDGSSVWGEVLVKAERDEQGEIIGYHGITRDVTERKQLEEQVRQLAFHDTLTLLPNRRLLLDHLDQAMGECRRSKDHGALLYLDLDNFKPLNDTHGHGVGDLLLIEVATRLKNCVRETDTVARIGGDEFVVLLRTLDSKEQLAEVQAMAVAEKIRARVAEMFVLRPAPDAPAIEHNCTASIGVTLFRGREESQESLLERADQAMYQAKETGRNRVQLAQAQS